MEPPGILYSRAQDAVRRVRPANHKALSQDRVFPQSTYQQFDMQRVGIGFLCGDEPRAHGNGCRARRQQFGKPLRHSRR
jgi:hypothetical protein